MTTHNATETCVDAGLKGVDHYASRLPAWRRKVRNYLIPLVRLETPYLALFQERCRSPALDTYFALTATLGTHTFFMVILPILFWCGYVELGRALVHILASGVYFTGFFKDLLCLPRPLSPPLQRISKSASVALEYGFPSTHSTNAVSVAVYAAWAVRSSSEERAGLTGLWIEMLFYAYAFSIVVGRLYCGMHGFFDVITGSLLGAGLAVVQCKYGAAFDEWIFNGPTLNLLVVTIVILVLVRIHPEPADNCPCYDDSVAFSAVMIGVQVGTWHFAGTSYSWSEPAPGTAPFILAEIGLLRAVLRIILGVVVIFAWRGSMKPTLLKMLPPIFRVVEDLGLLLPRRFFLPASQYASVPSLEKDDNVIPQASEIPGLLTTFRHPRKRTISIGPQSQADAYEAMAVRDIARRASLSSESAYGVPTWNGVDAAVSVAPSSPRAQQDRAPLNSTADSSSALEGNMRVAQLNQQSKGGKASNMARNQSSRNQNFREVFVDDEFINKDDVKMFSILQKPRVRYDVEVITKLIVYTGIAWLAVEGNPILFELCGLGMRHSIV